MAGVCLLNRVSLQMDAAYEPGQVLDQLPFAKRVELLPQP